METSLRETTLIFRALAHPCRLRLLVALAREKVCDVTTLARLCGQRQPHISQQLRALRDLGLVTGDKDGR